MVVLKTLAGLTADRIALLASSRKITPQSNAETGLMLFSSTVIWSIHSARTSERFDRTTRLPMNSTSTLRVWPPSLLLNRLWAAVRMRFAWIRVPVPSSYGPDGGANAWSREERPDQPYLWAQPIVVQRDGKHPSPRGSPGF